MTTLGRNDKCACGSGKKYKQCCLREDTAKGQSRKSEMVVPANNLVQLLRTAIAQHRGGHLAEAEASCRQILQRAPHHPEALYLLGLIAYQGSQLHLAVEFITQAVVADPVKPAFYNFLGKILIDLGRWEESISSYRKSISLQPEDAEVYSSLANIYQNQDMLDDAIACYTQALVLSPDAARTYNFLGNVYNKQGNGAAAIASYQKALSLKPDYATARYNLGNTFLGQGQLVEAVASFKKTLLFTPEKTSLQLRTATYLCLGNALQEQGNCTAAIESLENAISLQPDFFEAYNSLGNVLLEMGRIEEAIVSYKKALELKSDFVDLHSNYLMAIHYSPGYSQPDLINAHRTFAEQFEAPFRRDWPLHKNLRDPERRLKVGFVSGDFCTHPVAFFTEALLAHLNHNVLEIVLYYNHTLNDDVTLRLKGLCSLWRSLVGVTDDQAADLVRDDGIDILIDLSGHTAHNRLQLFARKPAPLQVAWLGYFDTTGMQSIDYILGDPHMLPSEEADHYVESPWYLPESYLCFTPPQFDVKIEELPAIRNGYITFGSFNNLAKLNDAVVSLWARVLLTVPGSKLFLKAKQFNDAAVRQAIAQRFCTQGIDAERLIFEGWSSNVEHFAAYNRMDVALDPFPFPGGTTSVNALWMGVPVLHLRGDRFIAHAGESILINVGLPEWIAADCDDYVRLAAELTGNLQPLAELRAGLRKKLLASPLCDAPRFARNFEAALHGMWRQWCFKSPAG